MKQYILSFLFLFLVPVIATSEVISSTHNGIETTYDPANQMIRNRISL